MASVNIFPTLAECFGIIFIGYICGKFNLFMKTQSKGISAFISNILLPALIFKAMVVVDFDKIDWYLWSGLFLSKVVVYVILLVFTLVFERTNKVGKAGLFAIFVTQSNDFAFGLPIFQCIFDTPQTAYLVDYLYLVAPMSLALLNPIGFALLEYQRAKNMIQQSLTENSNQLLGDSVKLSRNDLIRKITWLTVKGVITNPLVFTIVFGIAGNFLFHREIPGIFQNFFQALTSAFSACALFYLGLSLGLRMTKMTGATLVLPVLLVIVKGILMPLIMREFVTFFTASHKDINPRATNNSMDYTEEVTKLAFLYGTIPTAPTVQIFASKYGIAEDTIGSGLLIGTLFSAPIIYSAVYVLQVKGMSDLNMFGKIMGVVCKDVGIISTVCCIWVLLVLLLLKMFRRIPHQFTIILIMHQLMVGLLGSLFHVYSHSSDLIVCICVWLLLFGWFGVIIWTAILANVLSFVTTNKTSLIKEWKLQIMSLGLSLSVIFATIVLISTPDLVNQIKSSYYFLQSASFQNNKAMVVCYLISSIVCLSCVMISMVNMKRSAHGECPYREENKGNETEQLIKTKELPCSSCDLQPVCQENASIAMSTNSYSSIGDMESLDTSLCLARRTYDITHSSSSEKDLSFLKNLSELENISIAWKSLTYRFQISHHVILLLFTSLAILLNAILVVWFATSSDCYSNVFYLEMELLGIVLFYGQGFFTFIIFGFSKELFMLPVVERIFHGFSVCIPGKKIVLKDILEVDQDTLLLCERFKKHHIEKCAKDIVTSLKLRTTDFDEVFTGTSLVNWLIENSLAVDRSEAVLFGSSLLNGHVLSHCTNQHYFHDLPYLYRFVERTQLTEDVDSVEDQGKRKKRRFTKDV